MADKPTIFFSHSSKDADCLARLKAAFENKTGATFEVFLSSDGQSIPFGRNWVHRVQEALENARLMIVFVTPSSLNSEWIFFETGYVYAKGIRVVPVGFLGVDLYKVSPPLGLLQGFNISSRDGLNNLIALVNEVFDHRHPEQFTGDDYTTIVAAEESTSASLFRAFTPVIERFRLEFETGQTETPESIREAISKVLSERLIPCQFNGTQTFNCPGASIVVRDAKKERGRRGADVTEDSPVVQLICDPLISLERWQLMSAALVGLLERLPAREVRLVLDTELGYVHEVHCRAGKLTAGEVEFANRVGFLKINNLTFGISSLPVPTNAAAITILQESPEVDFAAVCSLLDVLWQRGILHPWTRPRHMYG